MNTAERTRAALRRYPFLTLALRAGTLNYQATARFLDIGEPDAVAAALRRHEGSVAELSTTAVRVQVRLERRIDTDEHLAWEGMGGDAPYSALRVQGDPPPGLLGLVVWALVLADIDIAGLHYDGSEAVVLVPDRAGPDGVRLIEALAEAVPELETAD